MEEKLPAGGGKLDSLSSWKIQLDNGWLPWVGLLVEILGTIIKYTDKSVNKSLLSELCPRVGIFQDRRAGESTQTSRYLGYGEEYYQTWI